MFHTACGGLTNLGIMSNNEEQPSGPVSGESDSETASDASMSANETVEENTSTVRIYRNGGAGRIRYDEKGNTVWEWEQPGQGDKTEDYVKCLGADELTMSSDSQKVRDIGAFTPYEED